MDRRRKNSFCGENGAIIIEASILLPVFLFIFMTFYSAVNICLIEAKVQNALSSVAKQVSSYSYFYYFSGAKAKVDNITNAANQTKDDINKNVIQNFSNIMTALNGISDDAHNIADDFKEGGSNLKDGDWGGLKEKAEDVSNHMGEIKTKAESGKNAVSGIVTYLKTHLGNKTAIKDFAFSMLQLLASDGIGIAKNALGELLAENLSRSLFTDSEQAFFDRIDFSKSQLFPGTTNEIILVAEYQVRIVPYIPVKLYYTISQQAVTRGWLDGDGGHVDRNTVAIKPIHNPKLQTNIWTEESSDTERSTIIRKDKLENKYSSQEGYLQTTRNNVVYKRSDNSFTLIASSNPMYNKSLEEVNDSEIEMMLRTNLATINQIHSTEKYKQKDIKGNITTVSFHPYEVYYEGTFDKKPVKKKINLVIPQDKGLDQKIRDIWESIDPSIRNNVELELDPSYGSNRVTYGDDE